MRDRQFQLQLGDLASSGTILVLGIALSIYASAIIYSQATHRRQERFDELARESALTLRLALAADRQTLRDVSDISLRGFLDHPGIVTDPLRNSIARNRTIADAAISLVIRDGDVGVWNNVQARLHHGGIASHVIDPSMRANAGEQAFIAWHTTRQNDGHAYAASDLLLLPAWRARIRSAIDSGRLVVSESAPSTVASRGRRIVMLRALYRDGTVPSDLRSRRADAYAIAMIEIDPRELASDGDNGALAEQRDIYLEDVTTASSPQLIYFQPSLVTPLQRSPRSLSELLKDDGIWQTTLTVGDRRWSLIFRPAWSPLGAWSNWPEWFALLSGLLFSFVAAGYSLYLASERRRTATLFGALIESERRLKTEATERSSVAEQLQNMIENLPGYIFRRVVGTDGVSRVSFLSEKAQMVSGFSCTDLNELSHDYPVNIDPAYRETFKAAVAEAVSNGTKLDLEYPMVLRGSRRWVRSMSIPRRRTDGSTVLDGITLDITEGKEAEERARYLSRHDPLTGLLNRAAFIELADAALDGNPNDGSTVSILSVDLDRFSNINSELGWQAGNDALSAMAKRLEDAAGPEAVLGYAGLDSFLILVKVTRPSDKVEGVASWLRDRIGAPLHVAGRRLRLSACIGAAVFPDHGNTATSLIVAADGALKAARADGHGTVKLAVSADLQHHNRSLLIEEQLRDAIAKRQFELYFQPQVETERETPTGLEALVRWHHPTRGLLGPGEFIDVAEATGLIVPLGSEVVRLACERIKEWSEKRVPLVPVSVNLSPRQLMEQNLVAQIGELMNHHSIPTGVLNFEITETAALQDTKEIRCVLDGLRGLGAKVSIDDFGVGFTSLRLLSKLPFDALKIDRSFITDLDHRPGDAAVVHGIASIGHELGMVVLAEGVETVGELEAIRTAGCDQVQGYLTGKPMPADEAVSVIARNAAESGVGV